MKCLLAFALIAFASAEFDSLRLLRPVQIARPDTVDSVKVVDAPVAANNAPAFAVNVVDAIPEVADAPVANDVAVNIVDAVPEVADAPVEDFAVRFVDNADVDEESPSYIPDAVFQVNIVQIPLPDSIVMPLDEVVIPKPVIIADAVETNADASVSVAEDTPVFMPPKQYPDPRWR